MSNMRVFLSVIIIIFNLQSWTKADDIRDFQIEGMSVGDSLLDYLSEQEILNSKRESKYDYYGLETSTFSLYQPGISFSLGYSIKF